MEILDADVDLKSFVPQAVAYNSPPCTANAPNETAKDGETIPRCKIRTTMPSGRFSSRALSPYTHSLDMPTKSMAVCALLESVA